MHKIITCGGGMLIGIIGAMIVVWLVGCKSFEPVQVAGQPDECNDFYTVMQYYSVQGGDSAFVGTVYEKCLQARKDAKCERVINCYKLYPENLEAFSRCVK